MVGEEMVGEEEEMVGEEMVGEGEEMGRRWGEGEEMGRIWRRWGLIPTIVATTLTLLFDLSLEALRPEHNTESRSQSPSHT